MGEAGGFGGKRERKGGAEGAWEARGGRTVRVGGCGDVLGRYKGVVYPSEVGASMNYNCSNTQ